MHLIPYACRAAKLLAIPSQTHIAGTLASLHLKAHSLKQQPQALAHRTHMHTGKQQSNPAHIKSSTDTYTRTQ